MKFIVTRLRLFSLYAVRINMNGALSVPSVTNDFGSIVPVPIPALAASIYGADDVH